MTDPRDAAQELDRVRATLEDLLRIVANVASRNFTEKPSLVEGDDMLAQFVVGFRFMIEDLERSLRSEQAEREELRRMNGRLKEVDQMKSRFINMAAHELGTPLTPLKLQLHMFRHIEQRDPARYQRGLDIMERNVDRLEFLVSDMLDVARLESGRLVLRQAPIDLRALVRDSVRSFEDLMRNAKINLEFEGQDELSINGDARRLSQVIDNLLGNALKFTPPGGAIRVRARRQGGIARVEVQDTGAGIKAEDLGRLFQPFTQVHDPMQQTRGGTGLGLYISKGIVENHQGHLWCESGGENRGSLFIIELPIIAAPMARVEPARVPQAKLGAA